MIASGCRFFRRKSEQKLDGIFVLSALEDVKDVWNVNLLHLAALVEQVRRHRVALHFGTNFFYKMLQSVLSLLISLSY